MLKVCFKLNMTIVKIIEQRNNFVVHCVDDNVADKSFKVKSIVILLKIGNEEKLPWSLKTVRTVIHKQT